jgi:hypothetical protein
MAKISAAKGDLMVKPINLTRWLKTYGGSEDQGAKTGRE